MGTNRSTTLTDKEKPNTWQYALEIADDTKLIAWIQQFGQFLHCAFYVNTPTLGSYVVGFPPSTTVPTSVLFSGRDADLSQAIATIFSSQLNRACYVSVNLPRDHSISLERMQPFLKEIIEQIREFQQ